MGKGKELAPQPRVTRTVVGEIPMPNFTFTDTNGLITIDHLFKLKPQDIFELKAQIVKVEGEPRKKVVPGPVESVVVD